MTSQVAQKNKEIVWTFWQKLDNAAPDRVPELVQDHYAYNIRWHGPHPINNLDGIETLYSGFWQPLYRSFPHLRRRTDILMAGAYEGKEWVSATGYLSGRFVGDWLGIPATGDRVSIRFGEFNALNDGKISESYVLLDLLDVIRQTRVLLLPGFGGEEGIVPGPASGDGILLSPQNEADGHTSLALVEAMLAGLGAYDRQGLGSMGQSRYWRADMMWYGPSGIGTTRGLQGFEDHHQRPFLQAFPDRLGGHHKARFAEGMYAASTGWPSLYASHLGEYNGVAATGKRVGMRVMDWWRRQGDLLAENWVMIDMIDAFRQLDVDLLQSLRARARTAGES